VTYVAGHTIVGSEAAVFIVAIAVGLAFAVGVKTTQQDKLRVGLNLKNSLYKNCIGLISKISGADFVDELYDFFVKLETGVYEIVVKDEKNEQIEIGHGYCQ
jgi:hypothetical protein